jgi:hypothetical protein
MRVSINSIDNTIVVDGKGMTVDCAGLRAEEISAVQWHGDHGEIEFIGHKKYNQTIDDFSRFQVYVDRAEPFPEPKP